MGDACGKGNSGEMPEGKRKMCKQVVKKLIIFNLSRNWSTVRTREKTSVNTSGNKPIKGRWIG